MMFAYDSIETAWARLREHLGGCFDESLTDIEKSWAFTSAEAERLGAEFYARSPAYLYELTHFHFSPWKDTFFSVVVRFARLHGLTRLGDVGCGVGLDGQALIGQGFEVEFYDLRSPSTGYLEWRLRRDLAREVAVRSPYEASFEACDLLYLADVLEHAAEPEQLISRVCAARCHICLNVFPHECCPTGVRRMPDDLHYPLDHWQLLPQFDATHYLLEVAASAENVVLLWSPRPT